MVEEIIDLGKFPKYSVAELPSCFTSRLVFQMMSFFKLNEPGKFYVFPQDKLDQLSSYVNLEFISEYNNYGIYFSYGARVSEIQKFVIIIPKEVFLQNRSVEYIKDYQQKYGITSADCTEVFIDIPFEEMKASVRDKNLIDKNKLFELTENYKVSNFKNITLDNDIRAIPQGILCIDFTRCLLDSNYFRCTSIDEKIQAVKKVCNDIVQRIGNNSAVVRSGNSDSFSRDELLIMDQYKEFISRLYALVAAYMGIKYGIHFIASKDIQRAINNNYTQIVSSLNRYASKYYKWLQNPIPFGIRKIDTNYAFMYVRNSKASTGRSSIWISAVMVDENTLEYKGEIDTYIFDLSSIEILDYTEYFDLHTLDYSHGLEEMKKLGNFLDGLQSRLLKNSDFTRSVDISNSFLFRFKGDMYVGYVEKSEIKQVYVTKPLSKYCKAKQKAVVLSEDALCSFLDSRLFEDGVSFIKSTVGNVNVEALFPKLDDTSDGIILKAINRESNSITGESGLHFDTTGLWGRISEEFRGNKVEKLTGFGIPVKGLRRQFLTPFGGPHMSGNKNEKPSLYINSHLWE